MQHVTAIEHDVRREQRAQKPEISITQHRQPQHAILADEASLHPEIADRIGAKFLRGIGGRNFRDAEAENQPDKREAQEDQSRPPLMALKKVGEKPARDASCNHRQEGSEFEHAIAPGEQRLRQKFRKQSVFRRTKQRRLRARQEDGRHFEVDILPAQSGNGKGHDRYFEKLGPDRDRALAVTIRQKAACHREEDERQREQSADDQHEPIAVSLLHGHPKNQEHDQVLQAVFVERALKLRDHQRPEAVPPARLRIVHHCLGRRTRQSFNYSRGTTFATFTHRDALTNICRSWGSAHLCMKRFGNPVTTDRTLVTSEFAAPN